MYTGLLLALLVSYTAMSQTKLPQIEWVDSVFEAMTPDERLGQLFMVAAYSNKNEAHYSQIDSLIVKYNLGGLIFFQGGPLRQARLTNRYQALSKIPLWIGMDAEWGLGMRLDSTISYPKQMTLGAMKDNTLVYQMGKQIAYECRRLGVHVSFSPVVDVNSNPENPVIGNRSFGENKENVADKGTAYARGLQDGRVLACAKHFPGHGDTDSDSHLTLPVVNNDKKRIELIDLYPFKRLFKDSVGSVMVAHMHIPAYDDRPNMATTLSSEVVTDLLKDKMDFKGIVFTDALNMKGVAKYNKPGEVDLKALQAGNDVLLFSENVPKAIELIKEAAKKKNFQKEIDKHVKKILTTKYWLNLTVPQFVKVDSLYQDLNNPSSQALRVKLYEEAFTVVKNKFSYLPIKRRDSLTFAAATIGLEKDNAVLSTFKKYADFKTFNVTKKGMNDFNYTKLGDSLIKYRIVSVSFHEMTNQRSKNYNIPAGAIEMIKRVSKKSKVIVTILGNPYSLKNFDGVDYLICGYEDNNTTRKIIPQVIFGAIKATATLPVSSSPTIKEGMGDTTALNKIFKYSIPESVGMSSYKLGKIDTIVQAAIKDKAMPGCQILLAKNGTIVYNKSFGTLNYQPLDSVNENTVYDLASITKVAATTLAVMHLFEKGKISLDSSISVYLPEMIGTNKENLSVQEVLSHQAGLVGFLEHWKKTLVLKMPKDNFYCNERYGNFCLPVTPSMYADLALADSMWKWTIQSPLLTKKEGQECYGYVYSDLGFYIMKAICERVLQKPINEFLYERFYNPLDFKLLGFRPLDRIPFAQIAPTEMDNYFRFQEIRGTVHDQGAAMLGGIGGHAGLFSNANDLAILIQMLLNEGVYNGQRYFKKETIKEFTKAHYFYNRRGLGWDKPSMEKNGPTSFYASHSTFGHTGFTGTCFWADPEKQLIYIFLSNRTFPTAENKKLVLQNIRTKIHDVAYESIIDEKTLNLTYNSVFPALKRNF